MRELLLEVLTAPGCRSCQRAKSVARQVIDELSYLDIRYREVNIIDDIDYAVKLGLRNTPAIALDGEHVFSPAPSVKQVREAILKIVENEQRVER